MDISNRPASQALALFNKGCRREHINKNTRTQNYTDGRLKRLRAQGICTKRNAW